MEQNLKLLELAFGSVKSVSIKDIGFKYPSDRTLDPTVLFPQVIKIESLASFDSNGIVLQQKIHGGTQVGCY